MLMDYGIFPVQDVFIVKNRGVVVTGKVSDGTFQIGDDVIIMRQDGSEIKSVIKAIEVFGHIEYAQKGDNVGLLLADISKENISSGDIVKR